MRLNRIKYGWKWERMSEKINWFLSRSLKERYELALSIAEMGLKLNPNIRDKSYDTGSTFKNIRILKKK
jgi:hypothetical protein